MKNLFVLFILLSVVAFSQTTSRWQVLDTGNGTQVEWEFTSKDSVGGGVSPTFQLKPGTYDFTQQGVVFLKKMVSTYGTPIHDVYLQFVGGSATVDTATVDTLCSQSIGETDSLGVSVFSFTTAGLNAQAGKWKIFIRNLNADINTGRITLFFPRRNS